MLSIQPSTKIAALLDEYPQLEDALIQLAPPFQKLKNPVLRRTIARLASLEQAAQVGRIPLTAMLNHLREAVGQSAWDPGEGNAQTETFFAPEPSWFHNEKIVAKINETEHDPDKMPVVTLLARAATLQPGNIIELTTSFIPAPGIDILKRKNLLVWTTEDESKQIKTYICKPFTDQTTETK